jgi:hypothetical protein
MRVLRKRAQAREQIREDDAQGRRVVWLVITLVVGRAVEDCTAPRNAQILSMNEEMAVSRVGKKGKDKCGIVYEAAGAVDEMSYAKGFASIGLLEERGWE